MLAVAQDSDLDRGATSVAPGTERTCALTRELKPAEDMTSTHAVSVVKRLFNAKRAGHAGTLDPLASGALPIALGEATKTVPFVMAPPFGISAAARLADSVKA